MAPESFYNIETGELIIEYVDGRFAIPKELEEVKSKLSKIGFDTRKINTRDVRVFGDGKIVVINPRNLFITEKIVEKYMVANPKFANFHF